MVYLPSTALPGTLYVYTDYDSAPCTIFYHWDILFVVVVIVPFNFPRLDSGITNNFLGNS